MPNDAVDTSREAVERLADSLTLFARTNAGMKAMVSAEKMLLALLARAEAAEALNRSHDTPAWQANERLNAQVDQLAAERDAAVAEAGRLREVMSSAADHMSRGTGEPSYRVRNRQAVAHLLAALEGGAK